MRILKGATGLTGVGWVYSLREGSNWGDVSRFHAHTVGSRFTKDVFESDVWGKFRVAPRRPNKGDGIAFYHSQSAGFARSDRFRRKPRISLVGSIEGVGWEGEEVTYLKVRADLSLARSLRDLPLLRSRSTEEFFRRSGMIRASVATMYFADAVAWFLLGQLLSGSSRTIR